MEAAAPAGDIFTFLIADIRGYTRFTLEHGDAAAARLAEHFANLVEVTLQPHGGTVLELRGDEALARFTSARGAIHAAVDLQSRFAEAGQESIFDHLGIGVGLDAGEAIPVKGGYRGAALNLAARLCSLAGSGEVLASDTVVNLARKLDTVTYAERGLAHLKGFADPVRVIKILPALPKKESLSEVETSAGTAAMDTAGSDGAPRSQLLPLGGYLGSLPSGPLVARAPELQRLSDAMESVVSGAGRLVLLAGEPGAGKTRLAQELTLEARNRGFLVAAGRCYETEQTVPYYPFLDALGMLFRALPHAVRADAAAQWPYLGALFPDDMGPVAEGMSGQDDQQRLFRATTGFLEAAAAVVPVALLLDDLHWADDASVKLLLHLARHTRTSAVLLLATYRDAEVGRNTTLGNGLLDLEREGLVERMAVHRLDRTQTASLIAATMDLSEISEEFAELVHKRTEGNPFFIQQVLRALVEQGDIYRQDGHWERVDINEIAVPETVRTVIAHRLGRLPDTARDVLQEAAVLGQTFAFDDLLALGGRSEDEIEASLEAGVAAGILQTSGDEVYGFDHVLTQHVLYLDLPPRRKRRLHQAAGEALERLPDRVRNRRAADIAQHFLQAGAAEKACPYVLQAGEWAESVFAHEQAEAQYRTAARLANEDEDLEREAQAQTGLGRTLMNQSRYPEALVGLERAVQLFRQAGNIEGSVQAVAEMGTLYRAWGKPAEGLARVEPLLTEIKSRPPSRQSAALLVALSHLYFVNGQPEETASAAGRAVEVAREVGDPQLLATALVRYGTALSQLKQLDEGVRILQEAIEISEANHIYSALGLAHGNLAEWYRLIGRSRLSVEHRRRSLESVERIADPSAVTFCLATLGWELFARGEWDEARELLQRSIDIAGTLGSSWYAGTAYCHMGQYRFAVGEWDIAREYLERCVEIRNETPSTLDYNWAQSLLAQIELHEGQVEAARVRVAPLCRQTGADVGSIRLLAPVLAQVYAALGDVERAEAIAADAVEDAREIDGRVDLPDALRVHGAILVQQGRPDDAVRVLREAIQVAADMEHPYTEARALLGLGEALRMLNDFEASREALEQAQATFLRLGAQPDASRTQDALTSLDSTGR